jgi:hypothetical protein
MHDVKNALGAARRPTSGAAVKFILTAGLAVSTTTALSQAPQRDPPVTAWVMGTTVYRGNHKGQTYVMHASVITPGNPQNPGGSAAFGVDDAGNITFIGHTEYQPAQGLSSVRRKFETPRPPMTGEQAPRYLMVCSWPVNEVHKTAGPLTVGYAERDDSATSVSKDGTLQESLNVKWTPVPSARAKEKFSKADYCGEVAKTGKSSAPPWLLPGKER